MIIKKPEGHVVVSECMRLVFSIKDYGGTQSYNRNFSRNSMLKKKKTEKCRKSNFGLKLLRKC